ncbi:MAG: hypothetical protein JNM39_14610 [Bdellovibrionaceae bacterium]|nr:hypothetical protein [Pseudobdellovibrionaceae bacterium]
MLCLKISAFLFAFSAGLPAEASDWSHRSAYEWVNGLLGKDVQESSINPGNRVAEIETVVLKSDLRADLQWRYLSRGKFVLRPRVLINGSQVGFSDTQAGYEDEKEIVQRTKIQPDLTEVFLDWSLGDRLGLTWGLQNYQWGPAELTGPSNPIFHFTTAQKSFLFKDKGRIINRINFSLGEIFSAVYLQEVADNQQTFWIADRSFEKKTLVKVELRSGVNANRYIGLVYGKQEAQKTFSGGYFNFSFTDAFSFYADGKVVDGSIAYYPQEVSPETYVLNTSEEKLLKSHQYVIGGIRWQGRLDFRLEYLFNSAGYKKEEIEKAVKSTQASNPFGLFNLNRLARNGNEVIGKEYAYISLRLPDLGKKRDASVSLRYLVSLQDESSSTQLDYDKVLNDMLNFYFEGTVNAGRKDTEFNLMEKGSAFMGVRLSW